jgi:hypothetical protein
MPEMWGQVKEILALALEQSADEQSAFVRKTCGEDAAPLAEVESLLVNYDGADTLLENPPAADLPSFHVVAMTARTIGAYRVLREIGHGGMAV